MNIHIKASQDKGGFKGDVGGGDRPHPPRGGPKVGKTQGKALVGLRSALLSSL